MQFSFVDTDLSQASADCLIIGVFHQGQLSAHAEALDVKSDGHLSRLLQLGDLPDRIGASLLLHQLDHITAPRVLVINCGKPDPLPVHQYQKVLKAQNRYLRQAKLSHVITAINQVAVQGRDMNWKLRLATRQAYMSLYCLNQFKSKPKPHKPLNELSFTLERSQRSRRQAYDSALKQAQATAHGMQLCCDLANSPAHVTTPEYLAQYAKELAKQHKACLQTKVLTEKDMKHLGMGAILAVGQGSDNPPRLITMEYKGAADDKAPLVFVGKGITFDTGGVNLKAAGPMLGMKYDMCGAASVFGLMQAVIDMQLPVNVIGVVAAAENMNDGRAYKPEDILTTLSGQTVEVQNTDAEGRLVLCDALTYCERFNPKIVIDIATLTGAIISALGQECAGLFTNNDLLADELIKAGKQSFDRLWRLPLWPEYQQALDVSSFADFVNSPMPVKGAGSITAACYLQRFASKFTWAHLDIAGVAATFGNKRHATGRPVPLLVQFVLNQLTEHA